MDIWFSDLHGFPLPPGSPFPAAKYRMLRERLQETGGAGPSVRFRPAPPVSDADLLRVHDGDYVEGLLTGKLPKEAMRRIGFPWSDELLRRARHATGGTLAACRSALASGVGVNLGGGTHHAFRDRGAGYCLFNDAAVAVACLRAEGFGGRTLVFDCDVHQGDGTASLFRHRPDVFTFSIHGRSNYPLRKVNGDMDIALEDGCRDAAYLSSLRSGIHRIADLFRPDLVIFVAGADPYRRDRFGRMALSKRGLFLRDRMVLGHFRRRGVPVAVTLGGGYAPDIGDIVDIHANTVRLAARCA